MKPCPHCQADNPVVYEDSLYCGNCNAAYPVYKRVYVAPDFKAEYIKMRDCATEVLEIVQTETAKAGVLLTREQIEVVQRTKDMAEQCDEWGNA